MSGKTIEIINTDAEGRLVLADGLTYARQLGATHLIDAATLTGAIGVALGMVNGGAFSNDDTTFEKFSEALKTSGEKFWRMPLGEEYADLIKSDIADIKNTGGRYGGACTAAEFLYKFAEDTPWIHLDIAGMAWIDEKRPISPRAQAGSLCGRSWSGCETSLSYIACGLSMPSHESARVSSRRAMAATASRNVFARDRAR